MSVRQHWWIKLALAAAVTLSGCAPEAPDMETGGGEPHTITGSYTVSNDFVLGTYYVEHAVALLDMHGFVIRDEEWELPVDSQVLGFMTYDAESKSGTFELSLPARPQGELNDVDNDGDEDPAVQVFAVGYSPNLYGGPFSQGDDRSRGWPSYLASIQTDRENNDEVIGGKLVVWAEGDAQEFPSGYGDDGLLFTEDDPVAALPAGYTIVDLDEDPFSFTKTAEPEMTLYEPADVAIKDFSGESYTGAFDHMFEIVRKEYAFNGVADKEPDWDTLYAELRPRVEAAEQARDPQAYYLALRDFTWAFQDGHVGLQGGMFEDQDFQSITSGGYGFALRGLDDGSVIVLYILEGGPAAEAGMQVGAQVTEFNGQPIEDALAAVKPYSLQSADFALRYQQLRYLLAAVPGTEASVTFTIPGGGSQTVNLTAVPERQSFTRTSLYFGVETDHLLPVESRLITENNAQVGYVRINSNYDDLNLVIRLFERALQEFQAREVSGVVIDMRYNNGGAPLGLAGFLHDQVIPMGQLEYYSEATGKFEPDGPREKIYPNENQYRFDKTVLLVGPACFSACEIDAYGFSQVPGVVVVGQYPTAGVEAEVARGQFMLPEGFSIQVPTGRFTLPNGSIFLDSQGVQPTLHVAVDSSTVLATEDIVLDAGIEAALQPVGAGIAPSGPPKVASQPEAEDALTAGVEFLEASARETYEAGAFAAPGVVTYSVSLGNESAIWGYPWCAANADVLAENMAAIELIFELDGEALQPGQLAVFDTEFNGQLCKLTYASLSDWPAGEHHLTTTARFTSEINDGVAAYPPGDYVIEYTVYVSP